MDFKISKTDLFAFIFILLLVSLAAFFHHGVYITDAVTGEHVNDITVQVSPWRIAFEPFLGPLTFCLRGHDPIREFLMLFVWVLAFILIFILANNLRSKQVTIFPRLGTGVLHWLAIVPIVLILWIGLLALMILAPLPTNTIVNHRQDTALVNFHSHSYYSHDGLISPENLVKWHKRNGFNAFFLTEHNHHNKTLEFIRNRESSPARNEDICVLAGQEYSGSNHLLLLGLSHDFISKDMPDSVAIDTVHSQQGVVIVAHWFADEHRSIQYYIDCGVDGFEIANQGEGIDYDRRIFRDIVSACQQNHLLMTGDCDYHGYGNACYVWNALSIPGWKQLSCLAKKEAIMSILRNRQADRIQVCTYKDRRFLNQSMLWLSPVLNTIDYFRSLNVWQSLSWLVWIFVLIILKQLAFAKRVFARFVTNSFFAPGIAGLVSASFVLGVGVRFLAMAPPLKDYNDILRENGMSLLIVGIIFSIYSIILLFVSGKKARKSARSQLT